MDETVGSLSKGSRVWYKQDAETWLLAEIKENSNGKPTVALLSGHPGKLLQGVEPSKLVPANPELQQAIADLTQLSYLNEPSILDNLFQRYGGDCIYTNAGPVLIAVNPCRNLPLYTSQVADQYKAGAFEAVNQLDPHIYLVAGAAFRDMVRQGTSQSLVINGESGAGKTETTKKAMQFFAALAGGTGVEGQVLETNPILEAFGNAKTLRNHNSSRFGKLIEIHFNKTNHICGARIRTYLLEKSRVVHQLKGERSYHIFYQLVRGTKDKTQREALRLPNKPSDFAYLAKSGCTDIDGVDDAANFAEVLEALADIGLSPADITALLASLSGILWLGNLKVEPVHADDSSRIKIDAALANAASMLGLREKDLAYALTHKKIKTRDELIVKPLTAQEAGDARDALAKALYAGVFGWIVAAINAKLDMGKKASGRFIAILDIYGFEQFTTNSFEQLCINYANERLQQQFTRHLFTLEQEEYEAEGIDWTKVEWVDNQACVDVIEAMPPKGLGVLAVLDSQCRFPKGSDETFMHALGDALSSNDHFGTDPRRQGEFFVKHYAGPVSYNASGFLDKNKDMLNTDLVELMESSCSPLITSIAATTADEMEGKRGGQTVSSRFTQQLRELVSMLDATGLHFVRCIKPNAKLSPGSFTSELVLQQLRCCGVLEVARVSRAGFPTRYRHADFVTRYKILLPREQQGMVLHNDGETRAAVVQLLAVFKVPPGQYEMGRTKVFFKPGVLGYVEDTWAKMQSSVLKLQAYTRMFFARKRFQQHRAAALLLQSAWRGRVARLQFAKDLREHKAAVCIQRHYRGGVQRAEYKKVHRAVTVFQAAERSRQLNKRVAARLAARRKREAAEAAAEAARREAEEGFLALKDQYGITQLSEVKAALACYAAMRSELDSRDPAEVAEALKLLGAVRNATGGAGGASALSNDQLASAVSLAAVAQQQLGANAAPKQLQEALAVAAVCKQELGADASEQKLREALAAAAACQAELGHCNGIEVQQALAAASLVRQEFGEDASGEQRLREALAAAALVKQEVGSYDRQQLQQRLALAAAAKQQLGGLVEPQRLRDALQLGDIAAQAGIYQPGQLQGQLKLAAAAASSTPEEVAAALELQRAVEAAAGHASPAQVKAALKLQAAAEDEGITDAAGLAAALAAAAAAAAAAASAAPVQQQQQSSSVSPQDDEASRLGAVVLSQGVSDAQELQTALNTYRHLRRDGHAFDARNARRACSMYAAAQSHGIADKRDFMAAAALYGVLREDGITSAGELRLAVAMYGAVREEGILDPEDLHAAIQLASIARDEGLANSDELRSVLAASRGSYYYAPGMRSSAGAAAADANGHSAAAAAAALGGLRASASGEQHGSLTEAMLQQQVAALSHQLDSEKAARSKYAKQLEQQAVEWMGQVKLLKEYIDSLRAKMPSHSSGGGPMPSLTLPASPLGGGKGSGGGETGRALRGLEGDWSSKAPLFDDDASFIREVVDGEVLAPDMQVQLELDRLRQKYEAWNKQFRERMREVQGALRRGATTASFAGMHSHTGMAPAAAGYSQPDQQQQQQLAPAGVKVARHSDSTGAPVDLKHMPDLTSPHLLEAEDWDGGQAGEAGKRGGKKGLFGKLLK
ncbi:hypothetical protein OEZ86_006714 [Tetradesmus obliquus]|nr:hypothetical protein OEZ86_006714 [Tetradesmus obliquus]